MENEYEVIVCPHCLNVEPVKVWQFLECKILDLPGDDICGCCGDSMLIDEFLFDGNFNISVTKHGPAISAYFNGEQATGDNWVSAILAAAAKFINRKLRKNHESI